MKRRMRIRNKILTSVLIIVVIMILSGCSIQKLAIREVADMMSGEMGASAFSGDEDIELIGGALPFSLKLNEIILEQEPEHTGLLLTTGMGFIGYSNVFVQTPAEMLSYEENELEQYMRNRAKKLYLRGRDYVLRGLEVRHPGITEILMGGPQDPEIQMNLETALEEMTIDDVPFLYWTAVGWFAAIGTDIFDMNLTLSVPKVVALVDRAYELNPDWSNGLIHEFYISYYASIPSGMMEGSREKALEHFRREVDLTKGKNPSPFVALATTMQINEQNAEEFRRLLVTAIEIDPEDDPDNKMAIVHAQRRARWYLENIEDYFLIDPDEMEEWE